MLFVAAAAAFADASSDLAGTYRCWSFNVGGSGGRCTSPPLVLNADGTYSMSGEHGTFSAAGGKVFLSESKSRGPGTIDSEGRIIFQYDYNALTHTVTYLRQGGPHAGAAGRPGGSVPVEVTVHFPAGDSVAWIDSAMLAEEGKAPDSGSTALARGEGKRTVAASFRSVPAGKVYTLYVGSGLDTRAVGSVDLREAKGPVKIALDAPRALGGKAPPKKLPRCNPRLPRYGQAACRP